MALRQPKRPPFRLIKPRHGRARRAVSTIVNPAIERALAFNRLNDIYRRVEAIGDDRPFVEKVLAAMSINVNVASAELDRIPETGPLLVVANHPFGAIDGIVLMSLLKRARPDSKTLANFLLGRIKELRESLILVDPFNNKQSKQRNLAPIKEALGHLRAGGAMGMFPAGEVAHLDLQQRGIVDPPWTDMVGRLARRTGATVVPVYFHGTNSPMFHLMGLIHPRLRTAMLPREMVKKHDTTITVRIGKPITAKRLDKLEDERAITDYCRARCDLLAAGSKRAKPVAKSHSDLQPVIDPVDPQALADEIASLPAERHLVDAGDQQVYCAPAQELPRVMREIGRLREIAFRQVGEGTGRALDIDRFDRLYQHLFVWHPEKRQIVGGYRLGLTDELVSRYGMRGLYTRTLFAFGWKLLKQIDPAVEVGRSFVVPEFQRSHAPLLNLWKGLATFCHRHNYCRLIGPVSISNDYHDVSRRLLIDFLRANNLAPQLASLCRARNPFRRKKRHTRFTTLPAVCVDDLKDVAELIDDIERQPRGVPILIKQYLRLGAVFLGCNLDPEFGDALDALMMVDLRKTDDRILSKYMGVEPLREFRAYHAQQA